MNWERIFITVQLVKILRVFDEWVGDVRSGRMCWIRNEKRFPSPHKCTSEYEGMEDEVGADRDDDDVFVFV